MRQLMVLLLLTVGTLGCAKTYERQATFIHEEYVPYESQGTARICGQAYLSFEGGKQHEASGDRVLLAPVTSYTKEAFQVKVLQGHTMVDPDPKAVKFEKHTMTDNKGRFCFTDLPAGEYYVIADIVLPASTKEDRKSQLAHARASVKADENVYILVTR